MIITRWRIYKHAKLTWKKYNDTLIIHFIFTLLWFFFLS